MNSSWKTTTFGLMSAIGAAVAMVDGIPHWLSIAAKVAAAAGIAGIGLAARDNNVTSEQAGAKPNRPIGTGLVSLFLALSLAGVAFTGCTATPARIAYNTVAAPAVSVDQAMMLWGDYVAQFHPSADTELKVKAAFEHYQAAELLAIDAAHLYADLAASGSTNSPGAQARNILASQTAATALADLLNLLRNLGLKV